MPTQLNRGGVWKQWRNAFPARNAFGNAAQHALDAETPSATSVKEAVTTLADLRPGECGTVRSLCGQVRERLRLLEMGVTPGTHIKVLRAAAFGGPIEVQVRGYQLSLRREEANCIYLQNGH